MNSSHCQGTLPEGPRNLMHQSLQRTNPSHGQISWPRLVFCSKSLICKQQSHITLPHSPQPSHHPQFNPSEHTVLYRHRFMQCFLQHSCPSRQPIPVCLYLGRTSIYLDHYASWLHRKPYLLFIDIETRLGQCEFCPQLYFTSIC